MVCLFTHSSLTEDSGRNQLNLSKDMSSKTMMRKLTQTVPLTNKTQVNKPQVHVTTAQQSVIKTKKKKNMLKHLLVNDSQFVPQYFVSESMNSSRGMLWLNLHHYLLQDLKGVLHC